MKMSLENVIRKGNTTSWTVAGLGLVMTGVGKAIGGTFGAGLMGFGLANMVLGLADIFRPAAQN